MLSVVFIKCFKFPNVNELVWSATTNVPHCANGSDCSAGLIEFRLINWVDSVCVDFFEGHSFYVSFFYKSIWLFSVVHILLLGSYKNKINILCPEHLMDDRGGETQSRTRSYTVIQERKRKKQQFTNKTASKAAEVHCGTSHSSPGL